MFRARGGSMPGCGTRTRASSRALAQHPMGGRRRRRRSGRHCRDRHRVEQRRPGGAGCSDPAVLQPRPRSGRRPGHQGRSPRRRALPRHHAGRVARRPPEHGGRRRVAGRSTSASSARRLAAEGCDGGEPTLPPEQQPQPLRRDSTEPDAAGGVHEQESVPPGTPIDKYVRATIEPFAESITTGAPLPIPGVATIAGVVTNATSGIVNGDTREARATTDIGSIDLAGGAVQHRRHALGGHPPHRRRRGERRAASRSAR